MHLTTRILAAAEEGQATGWGSKAPIIPHPGELIFGIIAIAILYFVVKSKVVPRLEAMYAERTAAIEGQIEQADKAQAEAQQALEQYRAQLAESREEASRIREEARAEGAQILAELREKAQSDSARLIEQAHTQIAAERQQALVTLRAEVGTLATQLASKVVGESLEDEARQRRTVERFLAELEAGEVEVQRPAAAGSTAVGVGGDA
ncbi:F0F1 ATP synthase subunit B [Angustibacter aerolatus]